MTPQALKSAILQLAIQGKLVPQRPEEGSAAPLLRPPKSSPPRTPKSSLPRSLKSSVPSSPFPPGTEPPFDIPETWRWVRLGDCTTYACRKDKVSPSAIPPETWSLDLEDIEKDTGKIIKYCSASDRRITGDKVLFRKGQILYSKLRPYLKKILVAPRDGICSPELVPFSVFDGIEVNYLVAVLRSPHVDFAINSVTYGVKMPRVGTETMVNLPIPLPPLPEQRRIVAKIEELLPLIDRYEQAWTQLEDFNRRFPADMQKSLLQLAIQGHLVDQRPEEGTAEVPAAPNTEKKKARRHGEEIEPPFEIPESWRWVRLATLCKSIADGDHQPPPQVSKGIPFLVISNVSGGVLDFSNTRHVSKEYYYNLSPERIAAQGDILFTVTGSYGIPVKVDCDVPFCFQRHMALLKLHPCLDLDYTFWLLKSPVIKNQCDIEATGTAQKTVGLRSLRNMLVPLPPLAEQKRIVAKLKELLLLCDGLEAVLTT